MAKQLLKRPIAKPASKKPAPAAKPVSAAKSTSKKPAAPAARPAAKVTARVEAKPVNGKAAAAKATKLPAAKAAAPAKRVNGDGKAATIDAKTPAKPVNGKTLTPKSANGSPSGAKAVNGAKAHATPAPEAPKTPGRPMLMQGPVASKALSKKGTFVLSKTPVPAPKPVKRKIERPEPTFVTLQPPVAQVRTSEKAVKNRAGLNQRDLDFFRDLLLQKRRELVGDMSHMEREALRESNSNVIVVNVDPTDQGTDAYEQEFTLGLVEKDRTLLREINDAMAKLQNGTYGICEGTGNPISRPRLEAQPWARHSIEFARILEKRKMMFRR